MFWSIILIVLVIYLFYKYFTWYFEYWNERDVPGPKPKFFFGNFNDSTLQKENIVVEINRICKAYRHSTLYVGVFSGKQPNLLIIDPQYAKDVLIRDCKSFYDNRFSEMVNQEKDKIFARNPFTLKGEEWKDKRAEIAPAFSNNRKNRDAQKKLRDEIKCAIHIDDAKITFEQLNYLKFLDQVFNESIRIIPPSNLLKREGETTRENGGLVFGLCTEEITLSDYNNKKLVGEKGMTVVIPIYSIHHDPDCYESPDEFIPERFSEENGGVKKYKEKGAWLPFSDGPRTCLGMKFGLMQSKAAIVEIIRNFDIEVNERNI